MNDSTDLAFKSTLSDLAGVDAGEARDLEAELFNRRSIKDMVTNLEKELGINPADRKKSKVIRHAEILAPGKDEDNEKLAMIINDDNTYKIIMWKDTWTMHGDYRVFVIYEEFLDEKKKRKLDENQSS